MCCYESEFQGATTNPSSPHFIDYCIRCDKDGRTIDGLCRSCREEIEEETCDCLDCNYDASAEADRLFAIIDPNE